MKASPHRSLLAVLALGAVSRLLYLYAFRSDPLASHLVHDARRYHEWASALASGQAWQEGAFHQAPLYPFLAGLVYRIFGTQPWSIYILQSVLGVLTILLVFRIARRAYGELAGLAAATVALLYSSFVFYETKLLPASLAVVLAALLIERMQIADGADRGVGWLVAGLVAGAAALTNPGFLVVVLLAVVWIASDRTRPLRHRGFRAAWLVLGVSLLVAPVAVRNYRVSGDRVLISSNGGITFFQGNNPNARGVFSTPPGFSGSIFTQREESRAIAELETGRQMGDGAISGFYFGKGLGFLAEDPPLSMRLVANKLFFALANDRQPLEYNARLDTNPFRWLFPLPFALILALAAVRIVPSEGLSWPDRAEHPILLLAAAEVAILLVFYVAERYRLPLMPALTALAGCGAVALVDRLRRRAPGAATMATTAVLVAALSFAWVPLARGDLRKQQTAMAYIDRARVLWEAGRQEDAVAALRCSLELDPVFAERHMDLARSLYSMGRIGEAEQAVREALRRDPSLVEANFLYGVLCVRQGRLEEADAAFSAVLARDPANENAANNLLGVLIHLGHQTRAVELWNEMTRRGMTVDPNLEQSMR